MTRAEYLVQLRTHQKNQRLTLRLYIVWFLLLFAIPTASFGAYFFFDISLKLLRRLMFWIFTTLPLIAFMLMRKLPEIRCTRCKTRHVLGAMADTAVATGRCINCGEPTFTDLVPTFQHTPTEALNRFLATHSKTSGKETLRLFLVLALCFAFALSVGDIVDFVANRVDITGGFFAWLRCVVSHLTGEGETPRDVLKALGILVALISAFVFGVIPVLRKSRKNFTCPNCKKTLATANMPHNIVILRATGQCPHCRQPVFSDAPARDHSQEPLIKQYLDEAAKTDKGELRQTLAFIPIIILLFLLAQPVIALVENADSQETLNRALLIFAATIPAFFIFSILTLRLCRPRRRKTPILCPLCHEPLAHPALLAITGNCTTCGEPISDSEKIAHVAESSDSKNLQP